MGQSLNSQMPPDVSSFESFPEKKRLKYRSYHVLFYFRGSRIPHNQLQTGLHPPANMMSLIAIPTLKNSVTIWSVCGKKMDCLYRSQNVQYSSGNSYMLNIFFLFWWVYISRVWWDSIGLFIHIPLNDVTWSSWRLISLATRLYVQYFVYANSKVSTNITVRYYWHFVMGIPSDCWTPPPPPPP